MKWKSEDDVLDASACVGGEKDGSSVSLCCSVAARVAKRVDVDGCCTDLEQLVEEYCESAGECESGGVNEDDDDDAEDEEPERRRLW